MLKLKMPITSEKKLVLGDYVTVHMSSMKTTRVYNAEPSDMQVYREELFERIHKQRGEIIQHTPAQGGDLIDVRCRGAA